MGRWIDLTGQRFGKLTAYSYSHVELSTGRKMAAWLCVCDCGNKKIIQAHHLRGGKSRSCGCSLFEEKKPGGVPEGKPKPASEHVIAMVEARFTKQCDGYANNKVRGTRSYNEARRKVRLPA